jgi:alkylhydroperoxidase family enzyme
MPRIAIPDDHAPYPLGYAAHLAPEMTAALVALSNTPYQHTVLTLREFEAARARVAEINGCRVCRTFRVAQDLPGYLTSLGEETAGAVHTHGPAPDEAFYRDVAEWRTSPLYGEREKLAIEFAERFCETPDALGYDDAFWSRARACFSDQEIYHLTVTVAAFVAAGRVVHVLGFDEGAVCAIGEAPARVAHAAE